MVLIESPRRLEVEATSGKDSIFTNLTLLENCVHRGPGVGIIYIERFGSGLGL